MGSSSAYPPLLRILCFPNPVLFLSCVFLFFPSFTLSGPVSVHSIAPNFTASNYQFIDHAGAFLASMNGSFQARIKNEKPESGSFYLVIIHVSSHSIVWTANRNSPISKTSKLEFLSSGLTLYNDTGYPIWSTLQNHSRKGSSVSSLQLLESGNLVLVDDENNTLWESFDFPTDTIVVGQRLRVGKSLISAMRKDDLSEGDYKFIVTGNDAILQWNGMTYWSLSMDVKAFRDTNFRVEFLVMNYTAIYLMGGTNGSQIVIRLVLHEGNDVLDNSSSFWIMKLDEIGRISVLKINPSDQSQQQEFAGPADKCDIPFICQRLGVCTNGGLCSCAPSFHSDPRTNGECTPIDRSLSFPGSCNGSASSDSSAIKYVNLRSDLDYFNNDFMRPVMQNVNLSVCQNLCSQNCSCLGIFHSLDSGSCYMIQNYLGSMMIKSSSTRDVNRLGYIKTIVVPGNQQVDSGEKKSGFPVVAMVLLPSSGVVIIAVIAIIICLRRRRRWKRYSTSSKKKYGGEDSLSSGDQDDIEFTSIPGLPVRFQYEDLVAATEDFRTQIGSGGFGTVYKGTLRDGTIAAVKRITCLGSQGKREFLTEIAVIGKIHHVNLVKLKGFCTHRGQRFLVYEYMNRGSLDRSLFGDGPVLTWQERFEIALGTARALAYLHSGCEHKIIHCDVKPENILLHDKSQVKISDFGLSKLLTPEQSGLFTTLRGTRGYLAPEWLTSSAISDKTDVYSYGMVLLEIVRGRKNSTHQTYSNSSGNDSNRGNTRSSSSSGDSGHRPIYFPLFSLEMHEERRYLELIDPRLMGRVASKDVEKLVRVALCCVHEEPNLRPSMSNVVGMLEGSMPLAEPRVESLNFLRFYGRRFTEASTLEENAEQNEFMFYRRPDGALSSDFTSSYNSFSYMSSQEVSGPR